MTIFINQEAGYVPVSTKTKQNDEENQSKLGRYSQCLINIRHHGDQCHNPELMRAPVNNAFYHLQNAEHRFHHITLFSHSL